MILLDPITRQPIGTIPKDEGQGGAKVALPQVDGDTSRMPSSIDSLLNDSYLPFMIGPIASNTPNLTSNARRVQSKMGQIQGQAFLQSFNRLRSSGRITEKEGDEANAPIGRLSAAQNLEDYKSALNELRTIVVSAIDKAQTQTGGAAASNILDDTDPLGIR